MTFCKNQFFVVATTSQHPPKDDTENLDVSHSDSHKLRLARFFHVTDRNTEQVMSGYALWPPQGPAKYAASRHVSRRVYNDPIYNYGLHSYGINARVHAGRPIQFIWPAYLWLLWMRPTRRASQSPRWLWIRRHILVMTC